MNLEDFEKYFLNDKNISSFKKIEPLVNCVETVQDKLFWSFYIIINGEVEFEYVKMLHKMKIIEKQVKISFLEKINLRRKEIMKKKLVKSLNTIEANLMEEKTTLETIVVLAFIEGVNIRFTDERTFFYIENDPDKEIHIIKNDCIVFKDDIKNKIKRYKVNKVLSSISNYKLEDLKKIYNILSIETSKLTKQKLYDNIIDLCSIKN